MASKLGKLATGAVATIGLLFCQAALPGPLTLTFEPIGGPPTFVCLDGGTCDSNGAPNFVTVILGPTTFSIPGIADGSAITAFSNFPGTPTFTIMDMTWTIVSTTGASTFEILASQQDFTSPVGPAKLQSVIGGDMLNGSVTGQEWVNLANLLNGLGPVGPGPQGPFTAPFSNTAVSATYTSAAPFSVTDRLRFTMGPQGTSTGDLRSITPAPIPEPATLALLGAAMAGFGFSRRRKQR